MRYGREYDRGGRRGRGYDGGFGRYDRGYPAGPAPRQGLGAEFGPPLPFPFVPFGYDPVMGQTAWPPYPYHGVAPGHDRDDRVPPRRSPAYGRGGDRALRAWAERYGYDVEFSIPPRGARR
jgi:hypothetical protein